MLELNMTDEFIQKSLNLSFFIYLFIIIIIIFFFKERKEVLPSVVL